MTRLMLSAALAAVLATPLSAPAFITGDLSGGGDFNGAVTSANAWITANPINGEEVNFWTLSGNAGDRVSFTITASDIELGLSLYQGQVDEFDLLVPGFNNEGDFDTNVFIAGTPAFGAIGTSLLDILLPVSGIYTLAIGGEEFAAAGLSFAYQLNVGVAPVPVPAAVWLLGSGVLALAAGRRRRALV